jgi:hypothetical protein
MSFVSTLRSLRRNRRPVERAIAAASNRSLRDDLILGAILRAGNPPRL